MMRRILVLILLAGCVQTTHAQPQRPRAELTPATETIRVRPGDSAQLSVKVRLPGSVHVQSDTPRDPALIPTVLSVDVPAGMRVERIRYPHSTDLVQAGQKQPLAVLGPEFTIDVRVSLAPATPPGDVIVPAQLRYQACDAALCYPPAKAAVQWVVRVDANGPASAAVATRDPR